MKKKPKHFIMFAYLKFADEQTAVSNFHSISSMKIRDKQVVVDYVGAKSLYLKKKKDLNMAKRELKRKRQLKNKNNKK